MMPQMRFFDGEAFSVFKVGPDTAVTLEGWSDLRSMLRSSKGLSRSWSDREALLNLRSHLF